MTKSYSAIQSQDAQGLTDYQLRASVPSVFAERAHMTRSSRYTYIPTAQIVSAMRGQGLLPVYAAQTYSRNEDRTPFTKHMLRFRRTQDINSLAKREEIPEVILINSHDGTSAYKLMSGFFRMACANGMIIGDSVSSCNIRHSGEATERVVEAAHVIAGGFEHTIEMVSDMKTIQMSQPESLLLAQTAAELRFDLEPGQKSPVNPADLLRSRRSADEKSDLWTTFNRIQENVIRGGIQTVVETPNGIKVGSTRNIKGIDQSVKLNRALWAMAERMKELKK